MREVERESGRERESERERVLVFSFGVRTLHIRGSNRQPTIIFAFWQVRLTHAPVCSGASCRDWLGFFVFFVKSKSDYYGEHEEKGATVNWLGGCWARFRL